MVSADGIKDIHGIDFQNLVVPGVAFIALGHIFGSCQNIVFKAVLKLHLAGVVRILRCHPVAEPDSRKPELFGTRDFQYPFIDNGTGHHQFRIGFIDPE